MYECVCVYVCVCVCVCERERGRVTDRQTDRERDVLGSLYVRARDKVCVRSCKREIASMIECVCVCVWEREREREREREIKYASLCVRERCEYVRVSYIKIRLVWEREREIEKERDRH